MHQCRWYRTETAHERSYVRRQSRVVASRNKIAFYRDGGISEINARRIRCRAIDLRRSRSRWSPDGSRIAFGAAGKGAGEFMSERRRLRSPGSRAILSLRQSVLVSRRTFDRVPGGIDEHEGIYVMNATDRISGVSRSQSRRLPCGLQTARSFVRSGRPARHECRGSGCRARTRVRHLVERDHASHPRPSVSMRIARRRAGRHSSRDAGAAAESATDGRRWRSGSRNSCGFSSFLRFGKAADIGVPFSVNTDSWDSPARR